VTFAMGGPNTRTNQIFINFSDANKRLDSMGFSPFGKVVKGMDVVDKIYSGYGEGAPSGAGPSQMLVQSKGNSYLKQSFPKLDYIKSATIVQ
jgi:peptidyl-prolyl cis-trans isomerase A (cyclophilin A)